MKKKFSNLVSIFPKNFSFFEDDLWTEQGRTCILQTLYRLGHQITIGKIITKKKIEKPKNFQCQKLMINDVAYLTMYSRADADKIRKPYY